MRSRQWFVSAFSLPGKVMSSYLAWGGSCWAGADRTGKEGTHTHTHTHSDRYNSGPWHTSSHSCMHVDTHTPVCTFLPSSQCDNPDGILVTAVTRGREPARTTNSGLCNAADIQLCDFCAVNQPQEQQYTGASKKINPTRLYCKDGVS